MIYYKLLRIKQIYYFLYFSPIDQVVDNKKRGLKLRLRILSVIGDNLAHIYE